MTITIENGYYTASHRGVDYTARLDPSDRWEVHSQRRALGAWSFGSVRYFDNAVAVSRALAAYRDLPLVIQQAI